MKHIARDEFLERIRFQFLLAEKLLLALLVLNAGGIVLHGGHTVFGGGLLAALTANVGAFMSQHFYSLACLREYAESGGERLSIVRGHVFYFGAIASALLSIVCLSAGLADA